MDRMAASADHFGFEFDVEGVDRLLDGVDADAPRCLRLLGAPDGGVELQVQNLGGVWGRYSAPSTAPADSRLARQEPKYRLSQKSFGGGFAPSKSSVTMPSSAPYAPNILKNVCSHHRNNSFLGHALLKNHRWE